MMVFFTTFTCSLLISTLYATATPLKGRDDVSPPITSPSGSGIVWKIGATETVTWDTSAIPEPLMNGGGVLVLGTIDSSGEHLDLDNPLAKVTWKDAQVQITVPSVSDGGDYIVALLGDDSNMSPKISIMGESSSSSSNTATSTASGPSTETTVTVPIPSTPLPSSSLSSTTVLSPTLPITTSALSSTGIAVTSSANATSAAPSAPLSTSAISSVAPSAAPTSSPSGSAMTSVSQVVLFACAILSMVTLL